MTTLQTYVFTNQQEAENFVLSYLETHQDFLNVIWQKFPRKKMSRKQKLPMVDTETNERIGQALAEHKAGLGIKIKTDEELANFLKSIKDDVRNRISA